MTMRMPYSFQIEKMRIREDLGKPETVLENGKVYIAENLVATVKTQDGKFIHGYHQVYDCICGHFVSLEDFYKAYKYKFVSERR